MLIFLWIMVSIDLNKKFLEWCLKPEGKKWSFICDFTLY